MLCTFWKVIGGRGLLGHLLYIIRSKFITETIMNTARPMHQYIRLMVRPIERTLAGYIKLCWALAGYIKLCRTLAGYIKLCRALALH